MSPTQSPISKLRNRQRLGARRVGFAAVAPPVFGREIDAKTALQFRVSASRPGRAGTVDLSVRVVYGPEAARGEGEDARVSRGDGASRSATVTLRATSECDPAKTATATVKIAR